MARVYMVWQQDLHKDTGNRRFTIVESEYDTMQDLAEALHTGPVVVSRLHTSRIEDEEKVHLIKRRSEMIITESFVHSIADPDNRYVEYEDAGPAA